MPRDLRALHVDRAGLVGETETGQLESIRAEGVRLDHISAGAHIFAMHVGHEIGLRQIQFVEAAVEKNAAGIQHRAHRAVTNEHATVKRFEKPLHRGPESGVRRANVEVRPRR